MSTPSHFVKLLNYAHQKKVSDIHLQTGAPPALRITGDLINVKTAPNTADEMLEICRELAPELASEKNLATLRERDGCYEVSGLCRFRFNIYRHNHKLGVIMRMIPPQIPSFEELGLPPVLRKIAHYERGLVLVTGATGSGKTTTLASMIDYLNSTHRGHILTIEDPIEFIHTHKKSRVSQREVGPDTDNFANALRAALRQDPNTILLGEMRDTETVDIALKAAETGHMVFSTIHTTDASKTIGRLVSMFPPDEQHSVRLRLADALKATISQRLLKRTDRAGLVLAQEIMVSNSAIQECIIDPTRTSQMNEFIIKGHEILGSQTFDQHLMELYTRGVITLEAALETASNPADFERNVNFVGAGAPMPSPQVSTSEKTYRGGGEAA